MSSPIRQLRGGLRQVAAARALVRQLLEDAPAPVRDEAVLLTDELVSNAVAHGGGTFSLWCELAEGYLRVAVADQRRSIPVVLRSGSDEEHGRGMSIVDAVAASWGLAVQATGKVVWFELAVAEASGANERDTRGRARPTGSERFEARPGRPGALLPSGG